MRGVDVFLRLTPLPLCGGHFHRLTGHHGREDALPFSNSGLLPVRAARPHLRTNVACATAASLAFHSEAFSGLPQSW
jgi:hypothetical protein